MPGEVQRLHLRERDVGTLSGGETLQALALALGVSDAVTARGVHPVGEPGN